MTINEIQFYQIDHTEKYQIMSIFITCQNIPGYQLHHIISFKNQLKFSQTGSFIMYIEHP